MTVIEDRERLATPRFAGEEAAIDALQPLLEFFHQDPDYRLQGHTAGAPLLSLEVGDETAPLPDDPLYAAILSLTGAQPLVPDASNTERSDYDDPALSDVIYRPFNDGRALVRVVSQRPDGYLQVHIYPFLPARSDQTLALGIAALNG